jgi:AAA domain
MGLHTDPIPTLHPDHCEYIHTAKPASEPHGFDPDQVIALNEALNGNKTYASIQGAPGTGKTRTVAKGLHRRDWANRKSDKFGMPLTLYVTETNLSAMNGAIACWEEYVPVAYSCTEQHFFVSLTTPEGKVLQLMQESGAILENWGAEPKEGNRESSIDEKPDIDEPEVEEEQKALGVVVATVSVPHFNHDINYEKLGRCGSWQFEKHLEGFYFQDLVVDEAALLRNPIFIPFVVRLIKRGLKKITLVGDSKQNAPYATSADNPTSSALDTFLKAYTAPLLTLSYRLPAPVCKILSDAYYNGMLRSPPNQAVRVKDCLWWVNVRGKAEVDFTLKSRRHLEEALAADWAMKKLDTERGSQASVAMLACYAGQVRQFKRHTKGVELSTVDGYQGREADRVFVSLMGDMPLIRDPRRTNVLLSRAREMLILVGDFHYWVQQKNNLPLARVALLARQHNVVTNYTPR